MNVFDDWTPCVLLTDVLLMSKSQFFQAQVSTVFPSTTFRLSIVHGRYKVAIQESYSRNETAIATVKLNLATGGKSYAVVSQ